MGLSQKWYFEHHNGNLHILKSFSARMTSKLQNTIFNMCEKIKQNPNWQVHPSDWFCVVAPHISKECVNR